ncbi:MAG: hypothetical protein CML66_14495 [Rhodobacteraceae bacterium]|nr:hypothetical protein [Paracoccaceae bacterium]
MTEFTRHLWAAIPVAFADAANGLLASQDYGPTNFAVPLGATDTVTHLGIRTVVRPSFEAWIVGVGAGSITVDGADPLAVAAVMAALSAEFADRSGPGDQGRAGWAAFLVGLGLHEIVNADV